MQCHNAISQYDALAYSRESEAVGAKQDIKFYDFLNDCSGSLEIDTWCGNLVCRSTSLTNEEHMALPAPYAANQRMFERYGREKMMSILLSNVLIGGMVGCMALVTLSLKVAGRTKP